MKVYFQALTFLFLAFSLISCEQQTALENRLENTEWELTRKITTRWISDISVSLPSTQFGDHPFDKHEIDKGITVSFQEDGTGNLVFDGRVEVFEWETSTRGEDLRVNIITQEQKLFKVLIKDRNLQLWEAESREKLEHSTRILIEKWEMTPQ